MASVKVVEHGNGDVSIGFESEGAFIPAITVSKARIGHYVERAGSLGERLKEGDEAAAAAVAEVPIAASGSSASKSEKGGGS